MIPPFVPYVPLRHPDDLLPIESTCRVVPTPDIWVEWFEANAEPSSTARAIPILSKLATWFDPFRFHRLKNILMTERYVGERRYDLLELPGKPTDRIIIKFREEKKK